ATLETGESAAAGMAEKTGISEAEAAEEKTKKAIEEGWERIKEREEEKENEQKNRENEGSDSAPSEEVATKNPPITNQAQRINNGTVIDLRARKGGGIDNDKKEDSDQLAA
ncbi:MAG TPA: hypothetical protein VMU70_01545, partial [Candidatus Tyrphobacter sp.]|nr:hypothetical protein [Candidatus Tyrphobacter sp.]